MQIAQIKILGKLPYTETEFKEDDFLKSQYQMLKRKYVTTLYTVLLLNHRKSAKSWRN